jgi:Subtilase family
VQIAVLDTGINRSHDRIKNEKRIKETISFVPGLTADQDTHGHGSHCAMLLNKAAPEADIYVARMSEGVEIAPEHVAEVSDACHQPFRSRLPS